MWCDTSKRMGKFALQIGNKTEVGVLGRIVEARLRSKGLKVVRDHVPPERLQTTDLSGEAVLNALRLLSPWCAGYELIRLGEDRDGGYLAPDDLDGIRACFSPGVDLASHFERDCIQRGIRVHLADASVDGPGPELLSHEKDYTFRKAFVGPCSQGEALISLADWVNAEAPGEDELMLQMDIEGAEYATLLATPKEVLNRFRVISLEFHGLHQTSFQLPHLLHLGVWQKLAETHVSVHLHPNNAVQQWRHPELDADLPRLVEVTYLRKDRVRGALSPVTQLPHPLDVDNVSEQPSVMLSPLLYGNGVT